MIRGEGEEVIHGVTPEQVFDFVLDPSQYTKADTKIIWVTKIADTDDGMVAREDGTFLGQKFLRGSVITRYRWQRPNRIEVTLEHGVPKAVSAWFEIDPVDGGTRVRHVEEYDLGHGAIGRLHDTLVAKWWDRSVKQEVREIKRLMEAGERGKGPS
jgi:hypothetical protein